MEYRLNKYISGSGYCSRREADKLIEAGKVTINGRRAQIGARVLPKQKVKVEGELIVNNIEPVYIAFNKPQGVVSTTDPKEKGNIVNFIRHEQRIFPIGRLDKDSQGLILLTNDGDIVNKILRAGNKHKKDYVVTVDRPITDEFMTRMAQGVPILDRVTRRCELEKINPVTFKISLIQGLNRQIRRMCEYFDYNVLKLERIQIMNIKLGTLGQGNWRELTDPELEVLFDMLEDSEKTAVAPSTVSNKAFNRTLEKHDVKTNYRKSNLAAKTTKSAKPGKPGSATAKPAKAGKPKSEASYFDDTQETTRKPKKGGNKLAGGKRIGKQRVKANQSKKMQNRPKMKSKKNSL